MIDRFGPGVGHLNYLVVPGVGMIEFLTTNHLLGWGISVIFDLAFLPGGREFDINFWENVKIPPYAPPETFAFSSKFSSVTYLDFLQARTIYYGTSNIKVS